MVKRVKNGDVFKVMLNETYCCFTQVVGRQMMSTYGLYWFAIFDAFGRIDETISSPDEITGQKLLYVVPTANSLIKWGEWQFVENSQILDHMYLPALRHGYKAETGTVVDYKNEHNRYDLPQSVFEKLRPYGTFSTASAVHERMKLHFKIESTLPLQEIFKEIDQPRKGTSVQDIFPEIYRNTWFDETADLYLQKPWLK